MTRLVKVLLVVASSAFLISCSSVSRHADRPAAQAYASVAQAHVTRVQADTSLDDLFAMYGDSGQGWTGGDGGASVPLPDGRIFWAFSDTWAGQVLPNHLRPANLPLLSNVAVIQKGDHFTTLYGGSASAPTAFMTSGVPSGDGYWNNAAVVSGDTLYVSYSAYSVLQPGYYKMLDTVFAVYSLPSLSLERVVPVALGSQLKWGVNFLRSGGYIYIYGAGFSGAASTGQFSQASMFVARAPANNLLGPWQYFTGKRWSTRSADAAPLTNVVKDPYSVGEIDGVYVLFTMQDAALSDELQAYFGPTPVGPFSHGENIWSTVLPEVKRYVNPNSIYEYGAYLHPEFTKGNTFVLSYQVNSFTSEGWILANLIRPRYVMITIGFGTQPHGILQANGAQHRTSSSTPVGSGAP
jgi:hypothetical protein